MIQTLNMHQGEARSIMVELLRRLATKIESGELLYQHGDLNFVQDDLSGDVRFFGDIFFVRRHIQSHQNHRAVDIEYKRLHPHETLEHKP